MATRRKKQAAASAWRAQCIAAAHANYCLLLAVCRRCEQQAGQQRVEEWQAHVHVVMGKLRPPTGRRLREREGAQQQAWATARSESKAFPHTLLTLYYGPLLTTLSLIQFCWTAHSLASAISHSKSGYTFQPYQHPQHLSLSTTPFSTRFPRVSAPSVAFILACSLHFPLWLPHRRTSTDLLPQHCASPQSTQPAKLRLIFQKKTFQGMFLTCSRLFVLFFPWFFASSWPGCDVNNAQRPC